MRVRSKANLRIFEDSSEEDSLFALADSNAENLTDEFAEMSADRFSIAASGTHTLPFGTVTTCAGIFISADASVLVSLNGLPNMTLAPLTGAVAGSPCRLLIEGSITSCVLTNPSTTDPVVGRFVLFGDS